MQIKVNGKDYPLQAPITVGALVESLALNTSQVAIERNLEIVPRSRWNETQLSEGDSIEVVRFIGGG